VYRRTVLLAAVVAGLPNNLLELHVGERVSFARSHVAASVTLADVVTETLGETPKFAHAAVRGDVAAHANEVVGGIGVFHDVTQPARRLAVVARVRPHEARRRRRRRRRNRRRTMFWFFRGLVESRDAVYLVRASNFSAQTTILLHYLYGLIVP